MPKKIIPYSRQFIDKSAQHNHLHFSALFVSRSHVDWVVARNLRVLECVRYGIQYDIIGSPVQAKAWKPQLRIPREGQQT